MQSNSSCLFSTPLCGTEKSAYNPKNSMWVEFEIFFLNFCADPNRNKYKNVPFYQMSSFNTTELVSHRLTCSKFSYFFSLLDCFINDIAPTTKDKMSLKEIREFERKVSKSNYPNKKDSQCLWWRLHSVTGIFNTLLKRRKRANYIKYA